MVGITRMFNRKEGAKGSNVNSIHSIFSDNRKLFFLFFILNFSFLISSAQLKYVVEDFEGLSDGNSELKSQGIFSFGAAKPEIVSGIYENKEEYSGQRALKLTTGTSPDYGGWGKGIGMFVELDQQTDYLNFFVLAPKGISQEIKIEIQEDDNSDHVYKKENDDAWVCLYKIEDKNGWQLVSIPLTKFKDNNIPGDGTFNIGYKNGKLFTVIMSFDKENFETKNTWSFDFICFSKGKLPAGQNLFAAAAASKGKCNLGAWSSEGNTANFVDIAKAFENNFKDECDKKLSVVHFFQSFSVNGGNNHHYPSVERINKIIEAGYTPMVTLEDHFVNSNPGVVQPNLYSITEGHFDSFFGYWASQIKQVKGTVLLRMFHEFNGDWYPWCTVNNNKDPYLVAKAFRYVVNIFRENNVTNVKWVWCPNSMSVPQESWNYIMDAYPGSEYVDYVGLDIYNGAGSGKGQSLWRSFRKEGIENYFQLTQKLPDKPLLICEVASRERGNTEQGQTKAEWIEQMSDALQSDMSQVKLLAWFNMKRKPLKLTLPTTQKNLSWRTS
ncbi:MAG: glycoside hydrolase family 26 [Bacteroidetes bacterium]|nr:glycoside hydrolase family 26 [Bacteroidota bacterium]